MPSDFRRNALMTAAVAVPMLACFARVVNFYPFPAWHLFSEVADAKAGRTHYTLIGTRFGGEEVEIPPIRITGALHCRIHMLAAYTDGNLSFKVASPHPKNVARLVAAGGVDRLPRGERMPDLLRSWARTYNGRLAKGSPDRLTRLRLEARRWPGGTYGDYDRPEYSWETTP